MIAYDSYKTNWSVAEVVTKDGRMTGIVHHRATKREQVVELQAEMLENCPLGRASPTRGSRLIDGSAPAVLCRQSTDSDNNQMEERR